MNGLGGWRRDSETAKPGRGPVAVVVSTLALVLAAGGLLGLAAPARAADELPKAEKLIQRMIEASGGSDAYAKMQSRFTRGKMSMPKMGLELTVSSWAIRPNKTYALMESPALGKIESGCDGDNVWEISAMQGPAVKKGAERAIQLREADFDSWPNWKKYYKSATTQAADTVAGKPAWRIEMVPMEGTPETMWFDVASGLLVKSAMKIQSEMGEVPIENYIEDYRDACGIKMPFRSRQVLMGGMQEMVFLTDSVACNPEVPADRFALPADIKALIEKEKAGEKGGEAPAATEPGAK